MNDRLNPIVGRRHVIRTLTGAAFVAVAGTPATHAAPASEVKKATAKARYQANSPEIQTFYRVNRYPKK